MKLSASAINLYAGCGRRWYFYYKEKIRKPIESPHLIFGGALHKAIEKLSVTLGTDSIPSLEEISSIFFEEWRSGVDSNEIVWTNSTQKNKMTNAGLQLVEQYYIYFTDFKPIMYVDPKSGQKQPAVEIKFDVPIPGHSQHTLSGIIDLIGINKAGEVGVFDHKTSSDKYSSFKINTHPQITIYAYAFREMIKQGVFPSLLGDKEDFVCFNVLIKKYRTDCEVTREKRVVENHDIAEMLENVNLIIKGIENDIFVPNYGDHCDNKYIGCDFQSECLAYRNKFQ